jgi:hypothetical protein
MAPGETIRVTKGLPEDARLLAVELNEPGWPETIAFVFETEEIHPTGELLVEHSVEHAHGIVPVEAIRTAMTGLSAHFIETEGKESLRIIDQWFQALDRAKG